jgi:hypothetical protein
MVRMALCSTPPHAEGIPVSVTVARVAVAEATPLALLVAIAANGWNLPLAAAREQAAACS